jgi:threonylcarbamoyladenosine tRNA methylthiotransferase MtaB
VQDGCDYKCTFCTIPLARGKSRSLTPEVVTDNFKKLLDEGYKEIILTGVNVGDYGKNLDLNFYSLLQNILKVPGDYRLRISSIEPNLLTDKILDLALSDERICRHFHIPLQSGSEKILKLMRRRYKRDFYEELIRKAAGKFDDLGIGVDVIVGFPGETDDDFLDTYNFLKSLPISYLHVFTYSERPDTLAIDMPGQVDYIERKRRNNMLRILSDKKRNEFYQGLIGTEAKALFEHDNKDGMMKGFSSNYARVAAKYDAAIVNKFSKVLIEKVEDNLCFGTVKS